MENITAIQFGLIGLAVMLAALVGYWLGYCDAREHLRQVWRPADADPPEEGERVLLKNGDTMATGFIQSRVGGIWVVCGGRAWPAAGWKWLPISGSEA